MNEPAPLPSTVPPMRAFLIMATQLYGTFAAVSAAIMFFIHENLLSSLTVDWPEDLATVDLRMWSFGYSLSMAITAGLLLLVLGEMLDLISPSFTRLRKYMANTLQGITWPYALYLAALSALGEELLFRGTVQPLAGIGVTSLLFGILHVGPEGFFSWWTIWAATAGLFLGLTYENSGNLWGPILAHFVINAIGLLRIALSQAAQRPPTDTST